MSEIGVVGTGHETAYGTPMGEMSVTFPPDLENWIGLRVAEGRYADAAEYVRDLIRRDQEGLVMDPVEETSEYIAWVREKIAEGDASGYIERDARDVLKEIIAERHARRG